MIDTAEALYGPYRWGRYDLLVLPPRFPFGGMENPRLTFATPTVIAGDRSLVSLVAHELAHSWSGNLVTNATWGDFWLNEGFTDLLREPHHGVALRRARRADAREPARRTTAATTRSRRDRARRTSTCTSTCAGRDPDDGMNVRSPTTRARSSCAPSSRPSAASASTPSCAATSTPCLPADDHRALPRLPGRRT